MVLAAWTQQKPELFLRNHHDVKKHKNPTTTAGFFLGTKPMGNKIWRGKKEGITLLSLALLRPHIDSSVQFWASPYQKGIEVLSCIQRRAMELVKGLEHKSYEQWLRELRLLGLGRGKAQGTPPHSLQLPERRLYWDGGRPLFWVTGWEEVVSSCTRGRLD